MQEHKNKGINGNSTNVSYIGVCDSTSKHLKTSRILLRNN